MNKRGSSFRKHWTQIVSFQDMSQTWEDTISEILSFLPFGWSYHEIVYKRRLGDTEDPTTRSRFNDGKIGVRKLPIRAQETLWEWKFDETGGIRGMIQLAPPTYKTSFPKGFLELCWETELSSIILADWQLERMEF